MTDDSRENSIIRFGRAMKKLKGLWFIGTGLIMLVVWEYLWWRVWSSPIAPGEPPLDSFLMGAPDGAVESGGCRRYSVTSNKHRLLTLCLNDVCLDCHWPVSPCLVAVSHLGRRRGRISSGHSAGLPIPAECQGPSFASSSSTSE
jgi:hypothetical protein